MLNKEAYDKSGLIYGIGHAVYTISDPRAVLLKELASELVAEKGCEKEFAFLELIEKRAIACFKKVKGDKKKVCSNVDFYSGFIYEMMGLPHEIYTPLFAMRLDGSPHRGIAFRWSSYHPSCIQECT